jgi:hypothetical protein
MLNSISAQYICKNTKNIQKSDYMDGFCLQGELDFRLLRRHLLPSEGFFFDVMAVHQFLCIID